MPGQVVCTLNVRSSYFVMVNTHCQAERLETADSVECDFVDDVLWQAGEDASIPVTSIGHGVRSPTNGPQPRRRPEGVLCFLL